MALPAHRKLTNARRTENPGRVTWASRRFPRSPALAMAACIGSSLAVSFGNEVFKAYDNPISARLPSRFPPAQVTTAPREDYPR